jgi:hypothetical protein
VTGWVAAGLLALALQQQQRNPFLVETPVDTVTVVDSELSWTCDGCLMKLPDPSTIAIFGHKPRAAGLFDDMNYRCALVVSRDKKNGWLIDRKENTAVRIASQELPEWCSE